VFGVQQGLNLLAPDGRNRANADFYSVTSAIQEQFSASPFLYALDQFGDAAQGALVDTFWDVLQLRALTPQWLGQTGGRLFRAALDAVIALAPEENLEAAWSEVRNTFRVISLVNRASAILNLPAGPLDISSVIRRAYLEGGQYAALWLIEGAGEEFADRNWTSTGLPRGLLSSGPGADLPESSLLMMHAGMGIAFARRTAEQLTPYTADPEIVAALRLFIDLVRTNARPGYQGPAFESLGLVTQTWYPRMVPLFDRNLWTLDTAALEFFWHGVGRATYFTPQYLLPGASPFDGVARMAPHQLGRLNGIAGAAWAFTLVNIQDPKVILNLLKRERDAVASNDAFSNGASSTVVMALDMIPGDPLPRALTDYRPDTSDQSLAELWRCLVQVPCERAIHRYFPALKRSGRLGEVFRYQDLERLAGEAGGRS
jgi:hypothetical protein